MRNILLGTTGHNTTKPTGFIFYFASYRVQRKKISQAKSILIKIYLYREFQNVSGSQNFIRAYTKHDKTTEKISAFKTIYNFSNAFTYVTTCINNLASFC